MKLYRVTNRKYASNFSGKGASFADGARWNHAGQPVIYFATDMATALVEAANYVPSPQLIPATYCKAIYEIDGEIPMIYLPPEDLPADWDAMPYPASTQAIGSLFLDNVSAALLMVPSVGVGVATEYNVAVANPNHPSIKSISLIDTIQPVYSHRMFKGLDSP